MDQPGVVLAAGERHVAHAQSVRLKSGERFAFGHIHLVVGGGVENAAGIELGQRAFHLFAVANIERRAFEAAHLISAPREFGAQLDAQLSGGPEYN